MPDQTTSQGNTTSTGWAVEDDGEVMLDPDGFVCENTSRTNNKKVNSLFVAKDGVLLTPGTSDSSSIPGVTR